MVAKSGGMGDFFMDKFWGTEKGRKYGIFFAVVAGVYFFMKYLSPVLSPFLLAFLIAGVLNKIAGKIPFKIRKHYLAGIILLLFSIVFVVLFFALGTWVFQKCGDLAGHASALENDFYILLSDCCNRLEKGFVYSDYAIIPFDMEGVYVISEQTQKLMEDYEELKEWWENEE